MGGGVFRAGKKESRWASGSAGKRTDGRAGELTRCRQRRGTGAAIKFKTLRRAVFCKHKSFDDARQIAVMRSNFRSCKFVTKRDNQTAVRNLIELNFRSRKFKMAARNRAAAKMLGYLRSMSKFRAISM